MDSKIFAALYIALIALAGCKADIGQKMSDAKSFDLFPSSGIEKKETVDINPKIGPERGLEAPDFEFVLLDGEVKGKLSELRGKPVFLNFWATWCGPCVMEMPDIESINKKYGDSVYVLVVNLGEQPEIVRAFIEKNEYSFNVALDEKMLLMNTFRVQTIPQTFIIDENGIITEHIVYSANEEIFEEALRPLLIE